MQLRIKMRIKIILQKRLDVELGKRCVALSPDLNARAGSTPYPLSVAKATAGMFTSAASAGEETRLGFGQYDTLVKVGLLSSVDTQVKPNFGTGLALGKVYSLTEAGKKALVDEKRTSFCIGGYKVDEVVGFSEPGNTMGATESTVRFTYSPTDEPSWATDPTLQDAFPHVKELLATKQEGTSEMVLNNDGWAANIDPF